MALLPRHRSHNVAQQSEASDHRVVIAGDVANHHMVETHRLVVAKTSDNSLG